jgi:hypothetical protein
MTAKLRFALLLLAMFCELRAHAYVRSRSSSGTPTHWAADCVQVQPDSGGTPDLDAATTFSVIQTSMQAWRGAISACGYMSIDYITPAPVEAHFDGKNVIKFRTDVWCHPNDSQSKDICYSAVAAGITTVFYVDRKGSADDGRLLDTDVELNDINFTFVIVDPPSGTTNSPRPGTSIADLENTLVHELGHVQGLDHTCTDSASPPGELDENGMTPPQCADLSSLPAAEYATITNATMFNTATPGEIKKRSPEPDDIDGLCNAYPLASDPKSCEKADLNGYLVHGCAFALRGAPDLACALAFIVAAFVLARRKRWRP